jgi:hypothetical protein
MSPEHVFRRHFVLQQNPERQGAVQVPQIHPKGWWAWSHKLQEMVHPVPQSETYCLVQTRTKQGVHPTTPMRWSSSNAVPTRLNDEIVQSNRPSRGGKL